MSLIRLKATQFRNFTVLDLKPEPNFNLIYGDNGSGKTSILEAIYYLSLARSFRSHLSNRVILHDTAQFSIFGLIENDAISTSVGLEKSRTSKIKLKINNEISGSSAELAKLLPLQLINPDSYQLLTAGPRLRRHFLDWGVFHVEHSFFSVWQRFQRALKQRNVALQQHNSYKQIHAWDKELVQHAKELASLRGQYVEKLTPIVIAFLADLIEIDRLSINYYPGWDTKLDLQEILTTNFSRDSQQGFTQYGPQKADLVIKVNEIPVEDVLSRGEQKLLVCAMRLAQGFLLKQLAGKSCIYLLDDLAAELDITHRKRIIEVLSRLQAQVFITAIEASALSTSLENLPTRVFHVEHGILRVIDPIESVPV